MKYLSSSGIEEFIVSDESSSNSVVSAFVDTLKDRIEKVRHTDNQIKVFEKKEKIKKKRAVNTDSDLSEFMT